MLGALLFLLALPSAEDEYTKVIEDAVGEFQAGRFVEARALFNRAHQLQPSARTLRGLGMAAFELSDYADAVVNLSQALADERRPLTEEQRAQVEELLGKARALTGHFRVEVDPPDAALTLDDRPIEKELVLNPGRYRLAASQAGHDPVDRTLEVKGGEDTSIALSLPKIAVETAAPPPPPPESSNTLSIVLLASGGALAAGAAGTSIWWIGRTKELDRCRDAGAACYNEPRLESQRNAALGATIGLGIAALATITTGAILIATPTSVAVEGTF